MDLLHTELWIAFGVIVFVMLAIDLGIFNRKSHEVGLKEALAWSAVWIGLALLFNVAIWHLLPPPAGVDFLAGYLLEKSLSVDNLFVFIIIFSFFKVPPAYQHRVLFWGIFGALVMRAIFIGLGIALIQKFHFVIYLFGVFLIYTGYKLAFKHDENPDVEANPVVRAARKYLPLTDAFRGDRFLVTEGGRRLFTPLFVVLLVIEASDVVFALDSIPAILAITTDPFIVYSSNVFAILGLRALYFALAGIMQLFKYLNYGLAFILSFVGVKMLIVDLYKIPTTVSLGVIGITLAACIAVSVIDERVKRRIERENALPGAPENLLPPVPRG